MGCSNSTEKEPKNKRSRSKTPHEHPYGCDPPEIRITGAETDRRSRRSSTSSSSSSSSSDSGKSDKNRRVKRKHKKKRKGSKKDKSDEVQNTDRTDPTPSPAETTEEPIVCNRITQEMLPEIAVCDGLGGGGGEKTEDNQNVLSPRDPETKDKDNTPESVPENKDEEDTKPQSEEEEKKSLQSTGEENVKPETNDE